MMIVSKYIHRLFSWGYELRFPGGKSRNGDSASFGVAFRFNRILGLLEFLIIPYNPRIESVKEGVEKVFEENPGGVLEREMLEETGIVVLDYDLLYEMSVPDNRPGREDLFHTKYYYIITKYDDTNMRWKQPSNSRMKPPVWVPIDLLEDKIWGHHRRFFNEAKKYLSFFCINESKSIAN